jgi:hypothetical protein
MIFAQLLPHLAEARKRIPHGVDNALQRAMRGAKHQVYVGYAALSNARLVLKHAFADMRALDVSRRRLKRDVEHRLRDAADAALVSLSAPLVTLIKELETRRKTKRLTRLTAAGNLDNTVTTLVPCVDFLLLVANVWCAVHALAIDRRGAAGADQHGLEATHRGELRKSFLRDDPTGSRRRSGAWATSYSRYGAHKPPPPTNLHPYRQDNRATQRVARRSTARRPTTRRTTADGGPARPDGARVSKQVRARASDMLRVMF